MKNLKEIERLKWEFLKRSDRFWDTWNYIRAQSFEDPGWLTLTKEWLDTGKFDKEEFHNLALRLAARSDYYYDHWPHPEIKDVVLRYYDYLISNAPEEEDFDKMWQQVFIEHKPIYEKISTFKRPVEDYRERVNMDIDIVFRNFQKQIKRNPNVDELKKNLAKLFYLNDCSTYLVVTQYDRTDKELKAILRDIAAILKRKIHIPKRVRKVEYYRYLKILDLREDNVKWKDICKEIYPDKKYDESLRTSLMADLRKAKRIVLDVETGNF